MKNRVARLILTACVILLYAPCAFADWADDFRATAEQAGVEIAIINALKIGVNPDDMVALVKEMGGVEPASAVKALYCSGVPGPRIMAAATKAGVPESVVVAGQRKSVGGCGPAFAKTFNPMDTPMYTAGAGTPARSGAGRPDGVPPGPPPGVPPGPPEGVVPGPPPGVPPGPPASPNRF